MRLGLFGRVSFYALAAAGVLSGPSRADTVIPSLSILTVTATSLPSDPGPITTSTRSTLRLDDSAGGFTLRNSVYLTDRGAPIIFGLTSRDAVEAILGQGNTIILSGNIYLLGQNAMTASASVGVPFSGSGGPPNGTLLLTGNIASAGAGPVSLSLSRGIVLAGTISDGSSPVTMAFRGQTLTGDNTYSGGTLGVVQVSRDSSLGAPNAPLGFSSNPAFGRGLDLQLTASIVSARPIGNLTVIAQAGTSSTFSGPIEFDGITASGPGDVTVTGPITSVTGIAESGPGTLTVRSTYTASLGATVPVGPTFTVSGGTLLLANSDLLNQRSIFNITGGTLRSTVAPQTISLRNYTQGHGGALVLRQLSSHQSEALAVDGNSILAGTLQIVPNAGYTPHAGDRFTVITSTGIDGQYDRIIGPAGLLMRSTLVRGFTGPGSASLTLQEVALSDLAASPNGGAVAQAISRGAAAGLSGSIFGTSGVFFGGTPEQVNGRDLDQLTPQRLQALRNVTFDQTSFIASSLDDWRADGREGAWHVFASAPLTRGNIAPTETTARARYDGVGVTTGFDYTRIEDFDFGALFSYQDADIHFDRSGSRGAARSAVPAVFAGYRAGALDAQVLLGYGFDEYRTDRRVQIGSGFDQTAHGATSGHSPFATAGAQYDLGGDSLHFGPAVDATYAHLGIDGFTEKNARDADLTLGALKADSLRTDIGGFVAYQPTDSLSAAFKLQWQREFAAGTTVWNADFAQSGSGGFVTVLPRLKGDAVAGSVSLRARVMTRVSLFADYAIQASRIETAQRLTAGVRVSF